MHETIATFAMQDKSKEDEMGTTELLADLRALTHLAEVLNNRHHAGLKITGAMWGELYQLTNRCKATIQEEEALKDEA